VSKTATAYTVWAQHYDCVPNPTRDADHAAMLRLLPRMAGCDLLEFGCGTGKNTVGFASVARSVWGLDASEAMLSMARRRTLPAHVHLTHVAVGAPWPTMSASMDVVTVSLVLEHIESLPQVFAEAARVLRPKGWLWISELHPIRQWQGSRAHFIDSTGRRHEPDCYQHGFSDYVDAARPWGFHLQEVEEPGDAERPRLLVMGFQLRPDGTNPVD